MAAGFVAGLLVGGLQPTIATLLRPDVQQHALDWQSRTFMVLQMGFAFMFIGLFLANYLEVRRRAYARYGNKKSYPKESGR
jgi:hypothetical protein